MEIDRNVCFVILLPIKYQIGFQLFFQLYFFKDLNVRAFESRIAGLVILRSRCLTRCTVFRELYSEPAIQGTCTETRSDSSEEKVLCKKSNTENKFGNNHFFLTPTL